MKGFPEAFLTLKNNAFLLSKFDFLCKHHIKLIERKCPAKERCLSLLEFVRMEMIFLNIVFSTVKGPQISLNIMRIKTVLFAHLQEARPRRKALFPAITQLPGKLCTEVSLSVS